jgi:hypothetical protein
MEIKRSGSQPSGKGPADWFTGTVRIDPLFDVPAPENKRGRESFHIDNGARAELVCRHAQAFADGCGRLCLSRAQSRGGASSALP